MTCPICGKDLQGRHVKTCGNRLCQSRLERISPRKCLCGNMGVKRTKGDWVCQRCLDLDSLRTVQDLKRRHAASQKYNPDEPVERGLVNYLRNIWLPEERRRERVLSFRQQLQQPL